MSSCPNKNLPEWKELEEKVGKNEFTLFLTADHAVVPVPQFLIDKGLAMHYMLGYC